MNIRNLVLCLFIVVITIVSARWLLNRTASHEEAMSHEGHGENESNFPRGPHGSRLLLQDQFGLEITIFEAGVPPEFHIYPYFEDKPIDPVSVDLVIELGRTGGVVDIFEFDAQGEYLRSDKVVTEPHSFDVSVSAVYLGRSYHWSYENYEGRTQISDELAREADVKTEIAGPAVIEESLSLTGRVEIDPNRVSHVRPRFPGLVKRIYTELGDVVKKGERILMIQSNESLQNYDVHASIDGLVIKRNVQVGEATSQEPLFTIVDLSSVWVELDIFAKDVSRIKRGQSVTMATLDGFTADGVIDWLAPLSSHASQSIHARVPVENTDGGLRPGQFVSARVSIAEHEVPLAVRQSAIQRFRDFQVVYAKFGEIYEVRMLEFGISNDEWLEVVGGLTPGTEYVTENSYLIKADIEKSGASHDH